MIDYFLLWVFVWIGKRWFPSVVFSTDPKTDRTTSIFFFDSEEQAKQLFTIIQENKLDQNLKKGD